MTELFVNDVSTTLASTTTTTATTLTVASGTGLPTPTGGDFIRLRLEPAVPDGTFELVQMTARSGVTLTVVRAQEGTVGVAWASGARVSAVLTAGAVVVLTQAVNLTYDPIDSAGFQEENALVEGMPVLQAVAATNVQEAIDYLNKFVYKSGHDWYLLGQRDSLRRVYPLVGSNPTTATGEFIPGIAPNGARVDPSGAALTLQPATQYPAQEITLSANTTLTLPPAVPGARLEVVAVQDGTGSRTLAWAAGSGNTLKWPAATAPTQTSAANSSDIYRFIATAAGVWRGYRAAADVR